MGTFAVLSLANPRFLVMSPWNRFTQKIQSSTSRSRVSPTSPHLEHVDPMGPHPEYVDSMGPYPGYLDPMEPYPAEGFSHGPDDMGDAPMLATWEIAARNLKSRPTRVGKQRVALGLKNHLVTPDKKLRILPSRSGHAPSDHTPIVPTTLPVEEQGVLEAATQSPEPFPLPSFAETSPSAGALTDLPVVENTSLSQDVPGTENPVASTHVSLAAGLPPTGPVSEHLSRLGEVFAELYEVSPIQTRLTRSLLTLLAEAQRSGDQAVASVLNKVLHESPGKLRQKTLETFAISSDKARELVEALRSDRRQTEQRWYGESRLSKDRSVFSVLPRERAGETAFLVRTGIVGVLIDPDIRTLDAFLDLGGTAADLCEALQTRPGLPGNDERLLRALQKRIPGFVFADRVTGKPFSLADGAVEGMFLDAFPLQNDGQGGGRGLALQVRCVDASMRRILLTGPTDWFAKDRPEEIWHNYLDFAQDGLDLLAICVGPGCDFDEQTPEFGRDGLGLSGCVRLLTQLRPAAAVLCDLSGELLARRGAFVEALGQYLGGETALYCAADLAAIDLVSRRPSDDF